MRYDACVMRNTISKKCVKLVDITILRYFSDSDQFELPVLFFQSCFLNRTSEVMQDIIAFENSIFLSSTLINLHNEFVSL